MESIDHECTKLKQQYETCFYAWYSENFLKGDTRDACEDLFQQYRACIDKTLKAKKIDILLEEHRRATVSSPGHERPNESSNNVSSQP